MSRDEYILYLADRVAAGEIDFIRVREELQRHGLNEAQSRLMIRLIDDEVLSRNLTRAKRERANSYLLVGILMTIAGLFSTIFFIGFGPVVYFIGYGPFATGLALIVAGRRGRLGTLAIRHHRVGRRFRSKLRL